MTKHEFLHSTMRDVDLRIEKFREEKEYRVKEIKYQSWLTGLFVLNAIGCSFSKGMKYPDNPIEVDHKSMDKIAKETGKTKEELTQEEQYFSMRVRQANANIDKIRKKKIDLKTGADKI